MADIDLTGDGASEDLGGGVTFERVDPDGSGTGNYDPFLTVRDSPVENGYNTDQKNQLDNVDSSGGVEGRTNATLLSQIPIKIIDGVAYYEFRVDLNEPDSEPIISLERLELYTSSTSATSSTFQGTSAADAFRLQDGFTKVFDLDSGGDTRLILSDETSSGSGTDDYRLLVPVSNFGNVDPTTTYLTMYVEFGQPSGDNDARATFEEWHTEFNATVNGVKFLDSDRDGIKDAGEAGMGGVTVFIDDDRDGVLDLNERSTITNSDGTFQFLGVTTTWADNSVYIVEQIPAGFDRTTGDFEVAAVVNGGASYVEIGNAPQVGSISGVKYADTNNDNTGDTPLAGWTINLYEDDDGDGVIDAEDALLATDVTDANGDYSFAGLTPGDYIVAEQIQSGWQAVSAPVVGATVTSGQDTDVDFVNEQDGGIAGTKFADTDNDDLGDTPLAGWTIKLYEDDDGDGVIDAEDALLATDVTDANGDYSFSGLTPGDYIVEEETQTGWTAISAAVVAATVVSGQTADIDFVNEQDGGIAGTKFADTDNDDLGDTPLAGWTVNLYEDDDGDGVIDAEDALLATDVTDANGDYSFSGLTPGDYIVEEETQAGWTAISAAVVAATVVSGQTADVDFVNEQDGSLSGTKFADTDNDDVGDTPLAGWTINLYEDDDGDGVIDAEDALLATDVTDASGNYSFDGLTPGDYIVEEVTQAGWTAISPVTVSVGVNAGLASDVDFVNEQDGAISGTKFADTDNDDVGDTGVPGWTVNLYEDDDGDGVIDAEDALLDTTVTDANGDYAFAGLSPGDYIVQEETRTGWQALSATVVAAAVVSGQTIDIDFVNEELGGITGFKFADLDNDDTGDLGLAGWTISLYEDDDGDGVIDAEDALLDTTVTGADGSYSFDGFEPGDYIVTETLQSGWQAVTPVQVAASITAGADTLVDFVNEELGSIGGSKFKDLDNDGVWDANETALPGWAISLFADDGDGVLDAGDTLLEATVTDANGNYNFDELAPGRYIVVEGTQSGWTQTAPNGADADPESADVNGGGMGFAEFGYVIDLVAGEDDDDNDFGNFQIPGPGVRTPGFWQSPNGVRFFDGIVGNETKSGPNFPSGELAPLGYLILGDDGDNVVEAGELQISVQDARTLLSPSNKDGGNMSFMLARDALATWLNHLAGNPVGDGSAGTPLYYMEEAVDWLIKYVNDNQSGAGNPLTVTDVTSHKVKGGSAAWTVGTSDDGIEAGATIHTSLDQYNNTGMINGVMFAQDGDFFI